MWFPKVTNQKPGGTSSLTHFQILEKGGESELEARKIKVGNYENALFDIRPTQKSHQTLGKELLHSQGETELFS